VGVEPETGGHEAGGKEQKQQKWAGNNELNPRRAAGHIGMIIWQSLSSYP
jgi:hypothetical protein